MGRNNVTSTADLSPPARRESRRRKKTSKTHWAPPGKGTDPGGAHSISGNAPKNHADWDDFAAIRTYPVASGVPWIPDVPRLPDVLPDVPERRGLIPAEPIRKEIYKHSL